MNDFVAVIIILALVVGGVILSVPYLNDGEEDSRIACNDMGAQRVKLNSGKLKVIGDWTAICVDRNPDIVYFIEGDNIQ